MQWKLHWVLEGSHCEDDFPDKACPSSVGLIRLAPQNYLLYNLDISPGETRNLTLTDYPEVVAHLTSLKNAHEASPGIFGRSEVALGGSDALEPCAPEARAAGCNAANAGGTDPQWPLCCQKVPPSGWDLGAAYGTP